MTSPVAGWIPAKFQLHEWASLRSELIWIYDREVRPQFLAGSLPAQNGYRLWLIRRGTVSIKTAQGTISAGPGKWVMPGEDYSAQLFSPRAHILSIHFVCQWPSGENLVTVDKTVAVKSRAHPGLEAAAKKLDRLLRREFPEEGRREQHYNRELSDYQVFNRFQRLFLDWLHAWFRFALENGGQITRMRSGDMRPFQAARVLNLAALDQPFPEARLQRETGLGLVRLNQLFFREFELTLRKFWDRRRLDFAKQCLETSGMPIKEISYRLNFRSNSHFVVWFRRMSGLRPSQYRQTHLRGSTRA